MLSTIGIDEDKALDHSMPWLKESFEAISERDNVATADALSTTFSASAAAYHGGELVDMLTQRIDDLLPGDLQEADFDQEGEIARLIADSGGFVIPIHAKAGENG